MRKSTGLLAALLFPAFVLAVMVALRPLSKEQRAKIKAIREKSGVQAAIAAAKRMGS